MGGQFRTGRSGVSHAGPHTHHDQHEHNPQCSYRCEGTVLEVHNEWMSVLVEHAHGRAKRWLNQSIPFSLENTEIHDPSGEALGTVRPGDRIEIRTRLARKIDMDEIGYVPVHRINILEAAPMDGARLAQKFKLNR